MDALILASRSNSSCGKTYNIVDPDQKTVRQYIKAYRQATGRTVRVIYLPVFLWKVSFNMLDILMQLVRRSSQNLSYKLRSISRGPEYDTSAAQKEFGWKAQFSFESGIKETFKIKDID